MAILVLVLVRLEFQVGLVEAVVGVCQEDQLVDQVIHLPLVLLKDKMVELVVLLLLGVVLVVEQVLLEELVEQIHNLHLHVLIQVEQVVL